MELVRELKGNKFKALVFVLLLVFFTSILANKIELPAADDMARHVKNGEMILSGHFEVLTQNFFSYTMPDTPFVNHHWLSGVLFYVLHETIGWTGLTIFKIIILLLAFTLLFITALKKSNFWTVAIFSVPAILILGERGALRPEIFSYLFIAIFLYTLIDSEERPDRKKIFWLLPIQLLWANMHIFFIVGPMMVAGFLLEKVILNRKHIKENLQIKNLALLIAGLVAVCFINPNGWKGALFPFQIFRNYGMYVAENQSLLNFIRTESFLQSVPVVAFFLSAVLLFVGLLFAWKRGEKPIFYTVGSIITIAGSFFIIRFLSFFSIIFLLVASFSFKRLFNKLQIFFSKTPVLYVKLPKIFSLFFVIFLLAVSFFKVSGGIYDYFYPGLGLSPRSTEAAEFWRQAGLEGPIFNDYDSGSYLIYNFFPKEKVFVDNRPEAYSEAFFRDTYLKALEHEEVWREIYHTYNFNVIFFYRYDGDDFASQFLKNRINDPEWALIYIDPYAAILVRNILKNEEIIAKYKITPDNITERTKYLWQSSSFTDQVNAADNFNLLGRTELGMKTFFSVVEKWPKKGKIWMVMAEWELGFDNPKSPLLAIAYLKKALDSGYRTAEAYAFLGAAYMRIGYFEKAEATLNTSLKINPNREDAQELLKIIMEQKTNL